MADNTQVSAGSGDLIRDIDRVGVKTQVVQLDAGGQAGESLVSSSNPLPVTAAALPLPAGASTAAGVAAAQAAIVAAIQAGPTGGGSSVAVTNFPATQPISATALPLPAGAATAAGVAAIVTALGTPAQAGATQAVSAASLPLPAGAATAANQATEITALAQLHTDLIAALPSGANTIGSVNVLGGNATAVKVDGSAVTQPVSAAALPLPSGAATAANQTSTVSALAQLHSDLIAPLPAGANLIGVVTLDSTSQASIAAAGQPTPDAPAAHRIVGNPDGDYAGLDLLEQVIDPNTGLQIQVRLANPPKLDGQGAAVPSDAPAPIYLNGAVGSVFLIDTTGYESLNLTSFTSAGTVTTADDPGATFVALSGTNRAIAAAYVTAFTAGGGFSFPAIARYIKITLTTAGYAVAYLRAAPWVAGYATPLASNVSQLNGSAPVTANVAGTLAVGGNVATGVAPTMYPAPIATVDAAGLTRRPLSDATGALTVGGVDPNGTQRQIKTDPIGFLAVQQAPTTAGAPNPAETLVQILAQMKVLTLYVRELSSSLNQGVPIADDEAAILQDPTLFN